MVGVGFGEADTVVEDLAGGRFHQADHVAQQRALTASAAAHDDEDFAAVDGEVEIAHHDEVAKRHREVTHLDVGALLFSGGGAAAGVGGGGRSSGARGALGRRSSALRGCGIVSRVVGRRVSHRICGQCRALQKPRMLKTKAKRPQAITIKVIPVTTAAKSPRRRPRRNWCRTGSRADNRRSR